jgi:EAL domain-containing protein (putative c-di-GMP-specific phosphodiesterase class I)
MLKDEIIKAFVNNEYELYYQPLVNRHREIVSYEVLTRWCSRGEILSPYYYMDILEREGFAETMFFYNIDKLLVDISEEFSRLVLCVRRESYKYLILCSEVKV